MIKASMSLGLSLIVTVSGLVSPVSASETPIKPLIAISEEGGFIAPAARIGAVPNLIGYSNGMVLTNEWISKRSDLIVMSQRKVSVTTLKARAKAIHDAAVTPKGGWGIPGVADVQDTRAQIWIPGIKTNISVYALRFVNGPNVSAAQSKARTKLAGAISALTSTVKKAKASRFAPAQYELWMLSELTNSGKLGLANPASVFCVSMGGTIQTVTSDAGDYGNCLLPDGSVQEEWAYFRAVSPTLNQWPEGTAVPSAKCSVVQASTFSKQLAAKNTTGLWLIPGGQAVRVLFRPVLPQEIGCNR